MPNNILNNDEEKELQAGQALQSMMSTPGWLIIKDQLESVAYHSWVDPREVDNQEDWVWRELNAFHASNNAKELLDFITKAVNRAEFLQKKKNGEIKTQRMGIGRPS